MTATFPLHVLGHISPRNNTYGGRALNVSRARVSTPLNRMNHPSSASWLSRDILSLFLVTGWCLSYGGAKIQPARRVKNGAGSVNKLMSHPCNDVHGMFMLDILWFSLIFSWYNQSQKEIWSFWRDRPMREGAFIPKIKDRFHSRILIEIYIIHFPILLVFSKYGIKEFHVVKCLWSFFRTQ